MNTINEKLRKLLRLAQSGSGGEKTNAEVLLRKFLKKHDLSIEDIEDDALSMQWFKYKRIGFEKRLLYQVIYSVIGDRPVYKGRGLRMQVGAEVSKLEKIEIELRFETYLKALDKELEIAFSAFLSVNDIYPDDEPKTASGDLDPEFLKRLLQSMRGMEKTPIRKAIA